MHISHFELTDFRSYSNLAIDIPKEGILLVGRNGYGKTNILEAIHMLLTGRSQRGATKREMVRSQASISHIGGIISQHEVPPVSVGLGLERSSKMLISLNGERITSLSQWFEYSTIISFSPFDINIVIGEPAERRKFLDLLLSQLDPLYLETLVRYKKICSHRNKLFSSAASDVEFDTYEYQMAELGSYLMHKRSELLREMKDETSHFYSEISEDHEVASVEYRPSVPSENTGLRDWQNVFCKGLKESRKRDSILGFSSIGPHRDDYRCFIQNRAAKSYASRGQCRSLSIALRLCALSLVNRQKGKGSIILVDDAFSELDPQRSERILPLLKGKGQIFITSVDGVKKSELLNVVPYKVTPGTLTAQ